MEKASGWPYLQAVHIVQFGLQLVRHLTSELLFQVWVNYDWGQFSGLICHQSKFYHPLFLLQL